MSQRNPTENEVNIFASSLVLNGCQSTAFRATFKGSKASADVIHQKASTLAAMDRVQQRLTELRGDIREVAAKEFKIDAAWVLRQAVKVHDRCMQAEPVLVSGEPTGEYKFEAAGANKSLELIGKHIDVQAFKEKQEIEIGGSITPWSQLRASIDE